MKLNYKQIKDISDLNKRLKSDTMEDGLFVQVLPFEQKSSRRTVGFKTEGVKVGSWKSMHGKTKISKLTPEHIIKRFRGNLELEFDESDDRVTIRNAGSINRQFVIYKSTELLNEVEAGNPASTTI